MCTKHELISMFYDGTRNLPPPLLTVESVYAYIVVVRALDVAVIALDVVVLRW